MDRPWIWIEQAVILAIHEEQPAEHGGATGICDAGLLALALGWPRNLAEYAKQDAADLAASHAFGIARNPPFIDGNKRTAFVAAELFLALNGQALDADDGDCVTTCLPSPPATWTKPASPGGCARICGSDKTPSGRHTASIGPQAPVLPRTPPRRRSAVLHQEPGTRRDLERAER